MVVDRYEPDTSPQRRDAGASPCAQLYIMVRHRYYMRIYHSVALGERGPAQAKPAARRYTVSQSLPGLSTLGYNCRQDIVDAQQALKGCVPYRDAVAMAHKIP